MKQHIKSARHSRRLKDYKENNNTFQQHHQHTKNRHDEIEKIFQKILNDDETMKESGDGDGDGDGGVTFDGMEVDDEEGGGDTTSNHEEATDDVNDAMKPSEEGTESSSSVAATATATNNAMVEEVTEYWRNHKEDIKKFLEWKMMQKMGTRVGDSTKIEKSPGGGDSTTHLQEVEIASQMVEGFHQEEMAVAAAATVSPPPSCKKLQPMPNPKANKEPKRVRPKVAKDTRQRQEREWKYIPESTFKFYLQGKRIDCFWSITTWFLKMQKMKTSLIF